MVTLPLLVTVAVLLSVAFLILFERKVFAGVQLRKGPNVVGPFGLFQSFADFGKFVAEETERWATVIRTAGIRAG